MNSDPKQPAIFPEAWASSWGEDEYGLWMGFTYKGVDHRLRWIEPGTFLMGSPEDEPERDGDETRHEVTLSEGFWLGETTVTQALWLAAMGENPSVFKGEERPVERVSWEDAQGFLETLNRERDDLGFRLPSEAEWEYACRAGTTTPFWFGDHITTEQVNYDGNFPYAGGEKGKYREETVEVKALPCNGWGLYQMHGNVLEWCGDLFGNYPRGSIMDPQGSDNTWTGVSLRGGAWESFAGGCRSAKRVKYGKDYFSRRVGFRLARGRQAKRRSGG
jgi:formylglycine-generating enzyme required for sulfatase activity